MSICTARAGLEMPRKPRRRRAPDLHRPLEDWGKLIGDVPAATAILDRFLHHAEVITITGKSYRLKNRPTKKHGDQTCQDEAE